MAKKERNLYNPNTDDRVMIPFGVVLPAHVSKLELRKLERESGFLYIYTLSYKVAPEVANLSFTHPVTGKQFPGSVFIGRRIKGKGIFFEPETQDQWKNSNYKQAFKDALAVEFPVEKIGDIEYLILDRDGVDIKQEEVIGKPCLVKTVADPYKDRNGVDQKALKVGDIYPNQDGKVLPAEEVEEDAPF